jgi:hypothetical protein
MFYVFRCALSAIAHNINHQHIAGVHVDCDPNLCTGRRQLAR